MENLQIDELLKYSDAFLLVMTVAIAQSLRPWLQGPDGVPPRNGRERMFEGDRIILAVLLIGIALATTAEAVSPQFDLHMAFRRVLATAGGAAMSFKLWRVFGPDRPKDGGV